jgi:hypothetical protein
VLDLMARRSGIDVGDAHVREPRIAMAAAGLEGAGQQSEARVRSATEWHGVEIGIGAEPARLARPRVHTASVHGISRRGGQRYARTRASLLPSRVSSRLWVPHTRMPFSDQRARRSQYGLAVSN